MKRLSFRKASVFFLLFGLLCFSSPTRAGIKIFESSKIGQAEVAAKRRPASIRIPIGESWLKKEKLEHVCSVIQRTFAPEYSSLLVKCEDVENPIEMVFDKSNYGVASAYRPSEKLVIYFSEGISPSGRKDRFVNIKDPD